METVNFQRGKGRKEREGVREKERRERERERERQTETETETETDRQTETDRMRNRHEDKRLDRLSKSHTCKKKNVKNQKKNPTKIQRYHKKLIEC